MSETAPHASEPTSASHRPQPAVIAREARPDGWWKKAVVYQIYPRSFADSDGDGVGDLRGIIGRLDYLKELGVDVVWLSPVYRSPQDDNGYDISDYQDVDPLFGTLADMDDLIAGLHERGMKIMMDLVVNHTSDEHPWFRESRDALSPRGDWYIWRPVREGFEAGEPGAEPTNWRSAFSGPAWQYDQHRGEYYLHLFSVKQPDLNWENPEVRRAVYDMMRWWVDRGVDGFRMDVINFISKRYPLTDGATAPGETLSSDVRGFVDGPRMDEFFQEMHRAVMEGENLITVGEMPGVTLEKAASYTDESHHEIAMVFQFEHVGLDSSPGEGKWALKPLEWRDLKENFARWENGLEGRGWNSLYWNNHDQPRIVSRWGDDSTEYRVASAKTLGTVLHLLKGTPYVYQGEEIGMTNAHFTSIHQYQDIEVRNYYRDAMAHGADEKSLLASFAAKSRDNARTPMQWDDGENAGFSTGTPWLEVNPNHRQINAEQALADPDSVFHHYRRLIELRHSEPVVQEGVFALLAPEDPQVFAYTRTLGDRRLLVVANMSSRPAEIPGDVPEIEGRVLLATHPDAGGRTLAAWESRVVELG